MTKNNRITDLFKKYFDKTATATERKELMLLISEANSDEELLQLMEEAYQAFVPQKNPFMLGKREKMLQQIQAGIADAETKEAAPKLQRKKTWLRYAVAAAILIFITTGTYLLVYKQTARQIAKADFTPGGNKAVLTLSNGSIIILNDAKNGKLASQGGIAINKTHDGEVNYDASKSAEIETAAALSYNTITTPKGGQYQVVLADGTKVWLNSVSSISFPTAFTGKERHVEITGEVYFEVAKNKAKPFFVKSGNQEVEVLGTHFNINNYTDEPDAKTTLLEGSVKIKQLNNGITATLQPGQQAIYKSSGFIIVKDADIERIVAWKNGMFQINDASIETIMRQAARWYDVDIEYEGKVPQRQFSGKIKRDVKASEFLQMISYFNVHFSIEGRKIIVKN
ncbi:FecR family protein [Mucilaginibacter gracilis]|uniref:FecR family protein n=1 Tax=Mucilaginibacter gracilis TaxID=423350 RepID=A0A495IZ72_9SPHI|nr:FecR family protein [Mucilaginibacter gracilis]RKR81803.1 FecR family protein [Mucilaginibacter gracilis]